MRHTVIAALCLAGTAGLSACNRTSDAEVQRAIQSVNVIDETNLNDIMLTVGDPKEAVAYFTKASSENPDRIDLKRGLAKSLIRAQRPAEAATVWQAVVASPEGTMDDRVTLADAYIRTNDWKKAEAELNRIPPTHETFERYRLEAMVADSRKDWKKADSFYEIAAGMTTQPSGVYNNWGFSKLSRQDYAGAELLFVRALTYDDTLFTAKNNLVMARGAQRKYDLPVVPMTQTEKAELLYTLALTALKKGDTAVGKALLQDAISTHPQHFEAAVRSLAALEA
ncbi:tetratricopeptide repeat protein [Rhodobacteraceae bacterium HSP-20]|uniref:Tetratricopeptide repeat protein n=1 Tax=Paragemmobacter amnigenus TaxID=2852097 RepID=A0ABS6J642_9RHOB|nr:tetratricopeptide repeat protein [Rhodobacter amnigenus]MBU9699231.1 tetratricopeptide repeat protein [Rhodobacter amnigenus]MBV4390458.1 tetratricopeptide repeat protein [Rhodobacter amnigenus]